jgi:hypothetical protein
MNPISAAFLVGAMIVVRKWSSGKSIEIDNVLGIAGVALGLAVIGTINKELGRAFGALVVVSVALWQAPDLLKKIEKGTKTGKGKPISKPYGPQER